RYREILEGEILPAARPQERPGIVHVPGGAEAYRTWIRVHTTLELEPEALHATGLAEIERIDAEFVELGRRVLGTKDLESTLAALAQELTGLPAFQRMLGSTAFAEGWGLYTERLSDEMGLYSSDMDRFGILSYDAWRAGRLVVDTGMHALGWTRRQAIDYLKLHSALGENNIANEGQRYLVW